MRTILNQKCVRAGAARASALCLLALAAVLAGSQEARAQWSQPDAGGNISSTNTGNVGVGTSAASSKLDVSGTSGVTVRTGGASAGISVFDRPSVPGDQLIFQSNAGNYTVINTATKNANFGSEKPSGLAMWTVDNAFTPNATQFQLQNSPAFGGVVFTQKFGTGAQGDKRVSFQTAWNQVSLPTQFVLDTTGNVGVGTATPSSVFEVFKDQPYGGSVDTMTQVRVNNPNASGFSTFSVWGAGAERGRLQYNAGMPNLFVTSRGTIPLHLGTNDTIRMTVDGASGNVGIGAAPSATARLHVAGDITVAGNINAKYQDVAEWVPTTQKLEAGTVVVLDKGRDNHVLASTGSYDTRVAGVVSAQPGIALGERGDDKALVATTGRVKVKVDATQAPISVGDLLVTSDREGYAMKSEPVLIGKRQFHAPGTIVGKALESLEKGTGEILVLLSLQ